VNPEDWPARWAEKGSILRTLDWSSAWRRDKSLMHGIITRQIKFKKFLQLCRDHHVPPQTWADKRDGKPIGRMVDGVFCTADSLRQAWHAHQIFSRWEPIEKFTALEVGAGFGCLARIVLEHYGCGRYFIVDAPQMHAIQKHYVKRDKLECLTRNADWPEVDLVVNINGFGEMEPAEVGRYFDLIQSRLIPGGVFYSSNRLTRVTDFCDYPFDQNWEYLMLERRILNNDQISVQCLCQRKILDKKGNLGIG